MATMFELVEIDPETGEEDQTLSIEPTTYAEAKRHLDEVIAEMEDEFDTYDQVWSWLMIRPAA